MTGPELIRLDVSEISPDHGSIEVGAAAFVPADPAPIGRPSDTYLYPTGH
jgi:hypothetical protein